MKVLFFMLLISYLIVTITLLLVSKPIKIKDKEVELCIGDIFIIMGILSIPVVNLLFSISFLIIRVIDGIFKKEYTGIIAQKSSKFLYSRIF